MNSEDICLQYKVGHYFRRPLFVVQSWSLLTIIVEVQWCSIYLSQSLKSYKKICSLSSYVIQMKLQQVQPRCLNIYTTHLKLSAIQNCNLKTSITLPFSYTIQFQCLKRLQNTMAGTLGKHICNLVPKLLNKSRETPEFEFLYSNHITLVKLKY